MAQGCADDGCTFWEKLLSFDHFFVTTSVSMQHNVQGIVGI